MAMAEKTPKKSRRKRLRRLIGMMFSLIALAVLAYVIIALISGGGAVGLKSVFTGIKNEELTAEFNFAAGKNRKFADLGDGIAAVGSLGLHVLSRDGEEIIREVFQTASPALKAENGRAIAYDIGGTEVRVFDSGEILHAVETNGPVVSADINKNGWFAVCVQEGGGYKGAVAVYNSKGKNVYRFDSAEGYILDAAVRGDNKTMAALALTETGSRITLFNLSDETPAAQFNLDGGLIIDIKYMADGKILAFAKNGILIIDKDGTGETLYDFEDRVLRAYDEDNGLIAVYLLDYGVGSQGRLVAMGQKNGEPAILETDREIIALSVREKTIAALRSDGLTVYDNTLAKADEDVNDSGSGELLSLEGGVLVAGDYSARVVCRTE